MKSLNPSVISSELTRLEARLASEKSPSIRKSLNKEISILRSKIPPFVKVSTKTPVKKTIPARGLREIQILESQLISPNLSPAARRELNIRLMATKEKYGLLKARNTEVENQVAKAVTPVYRITKDNNFKRLIYSEK